MDAPLPVPGQTQLRSPPPRKRSPLATIGAAIIGVLAKFKFLLVFLKTGGSMLLMIGIYALIFGWKFAVGFVLLILVHECGHLIAARIFGLPVSAPMFIPFMGAVIALKAAPRSAWMEAWVGIGGPIFGTMGAVLCLGIFLLTRNQLYLALAYSGFFLNLFNLAPIPPLDGGRIAGAISPWLWVAGVLGLAGYLVYRFYWYGFYHFNFIVLLIVLVGTPRVWRTLSNRDVRDAAYFELSASRRWTMAVLYFGLAALLALGMYATNFDPRAPAQVTL
jgi:Zn-dependent protease